MPFDLDNPEIPVERFGGKTIPLNVFSTAAVLKVSKEDAEEVLQLSKRIQEETTKAGIRGERAEAIRHVVVLAYDEIADKTPASAAEGLATIAWGVLRDDQVGVQDRLTTERLIKQLARDAGIDDAYAEQFTLIGARAALEEAREPKERDLTEAAARGDQNACRRLRNRNPFFFQIVQKASGKGTGDAFWSDLVLQAEAMVRRAEDKAIKGRINRFEGAIRSPLVRKELQNLYTAVRQTEEYINELDAHQSFIARRTMKILDNMFEEAKREKIFNREEWISNMSSDIRNEIFFLVKSEHPYRFLGRKGEEVPLVQKVWDSVEPISGVMIPTYPFFVNCPSPKEEGDAISHMVKHAAEKHGVSKKEWVERIESLVRAAQGEIDPENRIDSTIRMAGILYAVSRDPIPTGSKEFMLTQTLLHRIAHEGGLSWEEVSEVRDVMTAQAALDEAKNPENRDLIKNAVLGQEDAQRNLMDLNPVLFLLVEKNAKDKGLHETFWNDLVTDAKNYLDKTERKIDREFQNRMDSSMREFLEVNALKAVKTMADQIDSLWRLSHFNEDVGQVVANQLKRFYEKMRSPNVSEREPLFLESELVCEAARMRGSAGRSVRREAEVERV